jgi:hypothetical protein
MPPFVVHDIRRSVASGMARLGINLPVIEKVLNHVSGSFAGIVGGYRRHDFADEKRQAMEKWASHLAKVVAAPIGQSAEAALQQALPSQYARAGSEATPPTL